MKTVKVRDFFGNEIECFVHFTKYYNGNTCIQLFCDDGPYATVTTNTDKKLPVDTAVIKNYSENEGLDVVLQEVGLLSKPIGYQNTGFMRCPICKIDLEFNKEDK